IASAQSAPPVPPGDPVLKRLQAVEDSSRFAHDNLAKRIDEQMLFHRLEHLADVDRVRYTASAPRVIKNPTAQGAGNPVIITAYTFIPKKQPAGTKLPLLVFVHGGVHGNFDTSYVNSLRELLAQGYAVLAPEYRGSSGYGKDFWELIDYGGLENEDVF